MIINNNMIQEAQVVEDMYAEMGVNAVPYPSVLSFRPLLNKLEANIEQEDSQESRLAKLIVDRVKEKEIFDGPIEDPSLLDQNCEAFDLLISSVLPPLLRNTELKKLAAPFSLDAFYVTSGMKELLNNHTIKKIVKGSMEDIQCSMLIMACSLILNRFYDQNLEIDPPISFSVFNDQTGLKSHYKFNVDFQFVDIKLLKPLKPLSQEQINNLLSNIYDSELWLRYLPPENFSFEGFFIGDMTEITVEETLSNLKYRLLQKDAVVYRENIDELEKLIQVYFSSPSLHLGLTAIDYPPETAISHQYKIRFDFLADRQPYLLSPENKNSIYEKVCKYREVLLIEDLEEVKHKTPIESGLIERGFRSIMVAPLFSKNEDVIGLLEIASPNPFELHSFTEMKFKELISLFSLAVERSREEIDNQIEATIREQFTAVHPSVEWKFIETSYNLLEKREKDEKSAVIDPIVFDDVYPLYGQADIVSSSIKRNNAIQADLLDNLTRARSVLRKSLDEVDFPLVRQAIMKVDQGIKEITEDFNSNDESRLVELLQQEVHPIFEYLKKQFPELVGEVNQYFNYLDRDLKVVYRKRKAYEDSVVQINNAISNFLDREQKEAQRIIPHYFEKYKTDGVEYDLYVGQSLLKNDIFSEMHLKNLRLWQLIKMCQITKLVDDMQEELPVALTTAQLIFAYTTPLSIRFRMDEKQFDVDGAYNVRYEILKKRIDKAVIEGTNERLTVAGKIAVVYLQDRDKQEYLEYFKYLEHEKLITDDIEDVKLGKLQGVQGLRALRITVRSE